MLYSETQAGWGYSAFMEPSFEALHGAMVALMLWQTKHRAE
jgi:hypothetical protein